MYDFKRKSIFAEEQSLKLIETWIINKGLSSTFDDITYFNKSFN